MELKMNKLKKLIAGFIAITFLSVTPLIAGSGDFAGPFIQVSAKSIGVELDGHYTDADGVITKGTGGAIAQVGAIDLGYSIPLGDSFLIGIGVSHTPGEADIGKADDAANAADITIKAEEFYTYYIQPTISVSENSAVFVKIGESEADLKITGDFTGTKSSELSGTTYSLGTKTMFSSGMYFSAEAGYSDYDNIFVNDIGTADDNGTTGDAKADPSSAFGQFSIGYKF
jgi:opacity protein-like surface antigen